MDSLVNILKSIAEPTRLRILNILLKQELTVSEITDVLSYSQPRISRHLKLMCDAGVLQRVQEGSWVFYRLSSEHDVGKLIQLIADIMPEDSLIIQQDNQRLNDIRLESSLKAKSYFEENADKWNNIRKLYFSSPDIDKFLKQRAKQHCQKNNNCTLVDLGTGTGKMLELLAPYVSQATGVDNSQPMLAVARVMLAEKKINHCQVRQGDITKLNISDNHADIITLQHVLHYLNEPQLVIAEAARILKPQGELWIVDFRTHNNETMRDEYAHRRLGFDDEEMHTWASQNGLKCIENDVVSTLTVNEQALQIKLYIMAK